METNWHYIARQLEGYDQGSFQYQSDRLYRIASHADILSLEQLRQVDQTGMPQSFRNKILGWVQDHRVQIDQAIAEREQLKAEAELAVI